MMRPKLKIRWPLIARSLWRWWRRKEAVRAFRERRRKAGLCYDCSEPREAHTLRCKGCNEYHREQYKIWRHGAQLQMPKFWKENPDLIANNDRVLQEAWKAEHQ